MAEPTIPPNFFKFEIDVVDLGLLILSALISWLFYLIRIRNDRKYQSDSYIYQTFIIERLERFVDFSNEIEFIVNSAREKCLVVEETESETRRIIEKSDLELQEVFESFECTTIALVKAFCKEMHKNLKDESENYYDSCTKKLSDFMWCGNDNAKTFLIVKDVRQLKEKYLDVVILEIQKNNPIDKK